MPVELCIVIFKKLINEIKFDKFVHCTKMNDFDNNFSVLTVFEDVIVLHSPQFPIIKHYLKL